MLLLPDYQQTPYNISDFLILHIPLLNLFLFCQYPLANYKFYVSFSLFSLPLLLFSIIIKIKFKF